MEQQRQFRGVWFPKEVWLDTNLTPQEKMMIVEIDSLEDEEKGCWASNKHFVELFKITSTRSSQIIQNLKDKGYLRIEYDRDGKEITCRHLFINRPPYPDKFNNNQGMLKNNIGMLKNETGVCEFVKEGYVKKLKENNTYINNTNIDIYSQVEVELGMTLSPINFEKINYLIETYGEDKFKEALATTSNANKKSLNYLEGVLKNKNYKRVSNEPKWINEDLKPKKERELTDEEQRMLDEILEGIEANKNNV